MDQIKLTAEMLAEGWSSAELDRMARSGEVQRIRRGAYDWAPAGSPDHALRDLGWQIVRWIWEDLYHPEELRHRLERAFERGLRAV
jgi:hypothetical protein